MSSVLNMESAEGLGAVVVCFFGVLGKSSPSFGAVCSDKSDKVGGASCDDSVVRGVSLLHVRFDFFIAEAGVGTEDEEVDKLP